MRLKHRIIGKHDRVRYSSNRPQTRKDSRYKRKNITTVGQRSSARLRKWRTRMRNTVESAVMLDEDDDFINPGPSDRTSTPKKTSGSEGSSSKTALKGKSAAEVGSKRKIHEIGKKKVQQEQPKKKVKIAAKRNDKRTKPEKKKRLRVDIPQTYVD
ncbi:hypothetical protein LXL04_029431 [Taraxacum kok-saghyz]